MNSMTHETCWRPLRALRLAAVSLSLIVTGCEGERGPQGPQGEPGVLLTIDPNMSSLEKAFVGIGGKDALTHLQSFEIESSGERFITGEGYEPHSEPHLASVYSSIHTRYDVQNHRLNIRNQRTIRAYGLAVPQETTEVINDRFGYIFGREAILIESDGSNMGSDRWASIRRQQRFLNPHLILKDIAEDASLARDGGVAVLDGSLHHLVAVDDPVHPITLYVNAQTGLISKLATLESNHLHRDSLLEVFYVGWQQSEPDAPRFPSQVVISFHGKIIHTETRKSVSVNGILEDALFQFPEKASPSFNAEDSMRGATSHQFHQIFSSIGVPLDGLQTLVLPVKLAEGVWHLMGGSHHSLAIEQSSGIVIVDAPLYQDRSEAIIQWAKAQFPAKPITHIISTHHHEDHSAGLRTFVAEGAQVVMGEATAGFFRQIFRAPSNVRKDALANKPTPARIQTVSTDAAHTLDDPLRPVVAYPLDTVHAADMLFVYVPDAKVVFTSDLYNPGMATFPPGPAELYKGLTETYSLDVRTIAGGHGGTGDLDSLKATAGL